MNRLTTPRSEWERTLNGRQRAMAQTIADFWAEIGFAKLLCERHEQNAAVWEPLVAAAVDRVTGGLAAAGTPESLQALVASAESLLQPLYGAAKAVTVHCVGHAHIDMNWMWSWPETVTATLDSFATVLTLMEEFPQFTFSQSQASVYRIVEEHDPAMLARIAERVRQGRWEVTASHWVECDKNLSGSDALARHVLYTRQYMHDLFGLTAEDVPVDWSPDTFGHAATVPSYLRAAGVRYLYLHRPGADAAPRPLAFRWRSNDAAEVIVNNDMYWGYNNVVTAKNVLSKVNRFLRSVAEQTPEAGDIRDVLFVYGVGDHGGGPTRRDLRSVARLNDLPVFPTVEFSTARRFFDVLAQKAAALPIVTGELNCEFTGCYTSQSIIKRGNRIGEERLAEAEYATGLSTVLFGTPYPAILLSDAWKNILFNQFHDILPGSGVHDTRTHAHGLFQQSMAIAASQGRRAWRNVADAVDTRAFADSRCVGDVGYGAGVGFRAHEARPTMNDRRYGASGRPIVVFNPTPTQRQEIVECTIWDAATTDDGFGNRHYAVVYADGTQRRAQVLKKGDYWGHAFVTVAVPVAVESYGYTAIGVVEVDEPEQWSGYYGSQAADFVDTGNATAALVPRHVCAYSWRERSTVGLRNGLVRLEMDNAGGGIAAFVDERTGVDVIAKAAVLSILRFGYEQPHPMSSWHVDREFRDEPVVCSELRVEVDGPDVSVVLGRYRFGASEAVVRFELHRDDPSLYIGMNVNWFERGDDQRGVPTLKLAFNPSVPDASVRYEIPFGSIVRPAAAGDLPTQRWVLIANNSGGVVVANDSKYGCLWDGRTFAMHLIRGSYAPDPLPEVGAHEMRFSVTPITFGAAGDAPGATGATEVGGVTQAYRLGRVLNQPLVPVSTGVHGGRLPAVAAGIAVDSAEVVVSNIKIADDGGMVVCTLYHVSGAPIPLPLTLKFNRRLFGRIASAALVDLMEQSAGTVSAAPGSATVRVIAADAVAGEAGAGVGSDWCAVQIVAADAAGTAAGMPIPAILRPAIRFVTTDRSE